MHVLKDFQNTFQMDQDELAGSPENRNILKNSCLRFCFFSAKDLARLRSQENPPVQGQFAPRNTPATMPAGNAGG